MNTAQLTPRALDVIADSDECTAPIFRDPSAGCAGKPEALHIFLDAAAAGGLVLDGVDAADLYIKIFPERYAAAIAIATGEPA